jgi:hypothetical protein
MERKGKGRKTKFVKLYAEPSPWDFSQEKRPQCFWIAENIRDDIWALVFSKNVTRDNTWAKYEHSIQWSSFSSMIKEGWIHKWEFATKKEVFAEIL